jgi:hypothetical protein
MVLYIIQLKFFMKNNNLQDFVKSLKNIEDPIKVNMELQKIRSILNGTQKIIKENYSLDLKTINNSEIQKDEIKKIKNILKFQ